MFNRITKDRFLEAANTLFNNSLVSAEEHKENLRRINHPNGYNGVAVSSDGKYLFSINGEQVTLTEWLRSGAPGIEDLPGNDLAVKVQDGSGFVCLDVRWDYLNDPQPR